MPTRSEPFRQVSKGGHGCYGIVRGTAHFRGRGRQELTRTVSRPLSFQQRRSDVNANVLDIHTDCLDGGFNLRNHFRRKGGLLMDALGMLAC